jgi:glycosyltransferase involved in cell wall biosynthesis
LNILFLSDNFPPEVNAPANRTYEHCRRWVSAGHEVTVITCFPNFPSGKLHPGYRNRLYQRETMEGISVVRVWTLISSNDGFLLRILDYISFMISAIVAAIIQKRPDIVVGTSPQFFTICAARAVGFLIRRPWVLELRDFWPESIKAVGAMRDTVALRLIERLERHLYDKADHIIVVAESFERILVDRGVDRRKISVVTNGVDSASFHQLDGSPLRAQHGLEGKFVVGYIGTLGMAHALETVLDAASMIANDPELNDVRFIFVGDGARREALSKDAANRRLGNVIFVPSVPRKRAIEYLSILDASIVHLRKMELFEAVIPSKIFECMATGTPILMGVRGEALEIVAQAGAGIAFEPENPAHLVSVIRDLRKDPDLATALGKAGQLAARNFDRDALAKEMVVKLEQVANK